MLSYHETAPDFNNPSPRPQDGRQYMSVVFCRPAYPNLTRHPRPSRGKNWSTVTLSQNGKDIVAFEWFSTTWGRGTCWHDWVALESLSPNFFRGSNAVGMIPDMWAANMKALPKFRLTLKEMVELSTIESEEASKAADALDIVDGIEIYTQNQ